MPAFAEGGMNKGHEGIWHYSSPYHVTCTDIHVDLCWVLLRLYLHDIGFSVHANLVSAQSMDLCSQ